MNTLFWKDITYYRVGERGTVAPKTFEATAGWVRLVVTRHNEFPGKWMLRCAHLLIDLQELKSRDIENAMDEAIEVVRERLASAFVAIGQ